ncbi:homeobox domain-containing protein [Lactarius deliciosus]|nr:homeobox domain-containing protein [Lactarius deliciosus]
MFYTYVPNTIKTRKRTTPAQLEILEGVFVTDKKPNAPRRKELAKKLKMSPREVQVWFQNRRAKEKKAHGKFLPTGSSPISPPTSALLIPSVASPSSDTAPADPLPPSASASPVTKVEPQTPEQSPRATQNASWQPAQLPTPPITDSYDQPHRPHSIPSPPDPGPAAYGHRRSSLPILSLVPPQEPATATASIIHTGTPHAASAVALTNCA